MKRLFVPAAVAVVAAMGFTPAVRADDSSNIRSAGKSFAQALEKGDAAAARKYAVTNDKTSQLVDLLAGMAKATKTLEDAAVDKFGDDGKTIARGGFGSRMNWQKQLDKADIKVEGDTATVTPKPEEDAQPPQRPGRNPRGGASEPKEPIRFKKQGGAWKLDLTAMSGLNSVDIDQMKAMTPLMEKAFNDTAGEIKDGKYKSSQEAQRALGQKLATAFQNAAREGRVGGKRGGSGDSGDKGSDDGK